MTITGWPWLVSFLIGSSRSGVRPLPAHQVSQLSRLLFAGSIHACGSQLGSVLRLAVRAVRQLRQANILKSEAAKAESAKAAEGPKPKEPKPAAAGMCKIRAAHMRIVRL